MAFMKTTQTNRGFVLKHFKDSYGVGCSLQESSAAIEPNVWLGVDRPMLSITYADALANGLKLQKRNPDTNENGWCDFPVPDDVLIESRMHLNQEQAKGLAEQLMFFANNGYLPEEEIL